MLFIVPAIIDLLCVVLLAVGWRIEAGAIRGNEGLALLVVVREGLGMVLVGAVAIVRPLVRGLVSEARRRVLLRRRVAEVVLVSWVEDRRGRLALVALVVPRVQVVIVLLAILMRGPHPLVHAWRPIERLAARREVARLAWICVRIVPWRRLRRTPKALGCWEPI